MILITVETSGPTPRRVAARLNKIKKTMWESLGVDWHQKMRPKHFTHRGAAEYGYTPRKGEDATGKRFRNSYTGKKFRLFHHTDPLVYTGTSKQLTRLRDVRATGKGCRVVMRAPALNLKPKGGRIDMRDEMTRISTAEQLRLTQSGGDRLKRGISKVRGRSRRTY